MDIKIANYDKSETDTLKLDVYNCNSSFVNTLRRTIITEVETISFHTEDYETSDIKIIENTSSLHNEFILHRIGLIPVNTQNIESFDVTKYKFIIDVENKSNIPIDITTKDIKILNLETDTFENNESFFPRNPITKDYILINRLKPTPYGTGEKLHLEGKASKGIGKTHIRYSPVSNVCFINKVNPEIYNAEFEKYKIENPDVDSKELENKFKIEESEKCFYINDNGEPYVFEFTVESCGVMKPYAILVEGLNKIIFKLKYFISEFNKSISNNDSIVDIKESTSLMKAFDVVVNGETHTLGHLLQSHINEMFKEKNIFVGYMNPHPLEQKIIFRINVSNINELKELFTKTSSELISQCENLVAIISKDFKSKIKISPKAKVKVKAKVKAK